MTSVFNLEDSLVVGHDYIQERNRWFAVIWSETGLGKSYLSLGFPPPLYIYSLDTDGPFPALRKKIKDNELRPDQVFITEGWKACFGNDIPFVMKPSDYSKIWKYSLDWIEAVSKEHGNSGGTMIIDAASTLWKICSEVTVEPRKKAAEAAKQKFLQFDWKYANEAFSTPIKGVRATGLNLVLLNQASEIHNAKGQATGLYRYHGNKTVREEADIVIRIGIDQNPKDLSIKSRWILVEKCRDDNSLIGAVLRDGEVDFSGIEDMLIGTEIPDERMEVLAIGDRLDETAGLDDEEKK